MSRTCLLLGLLVPPTASAQGAPASPSPPGGVVRDSQAQPNPGSARLSGRVTAADTGGPLRRAEVVAAPPGLNAGQMQQQSRSVTTDADGRWELRGLPAGRYNVTVSKGGYLTLQYGQRRPYEPGKLLDVADGQVLQKIDLSLPKGGVISGRVLDEFGDPATPAVVVAMRQRYVDGQRVLLPVEDTGIMMLFKGGLTDDTGAYRLHGLPPGTYYLSAMFGPIGPGRSDDPTTYAPTFYPGTPSLGEAQRVTVGVGQETQNITFNLTTVRVARVTGTVVSSSGQPARASVRLAFTMPGGLGANRYSSTASADGAFTISNVPPGEYRLQAHLSQGLPVPEVASILITVGGQDVTGLAIATAPAATASGRVLFEGASNAGARPGSISISAAPATAESALDVLGGSAGLRDQETFELRGLWGRRVFRIDNLPRGWLLKSVTLDATDITDSGIEFKPGQNVSGIEIVLTARSTSLSGAVQDDRGRPLTDYTVVAFSPESGKWGYQTRFVRSARPNQDGRFDLQGLPPGDYLVAALEYLEPGDESDPELLEKWRAGSTSVTLGDGETKSITLRLTR